MIEYLGQRDASEPFFAYVAFQAIHIPVQAPREFTDNYEGVYAQGWDVRREQRFDRAKSIGLIPANAPAPEPHPDLRTWSSLSLEEKAHYERSMMVNAGMLEAMDFHIGRLVDDLRNQGVLDNTVFIITSDNGPEFNDPIQDTIYRIWMRANGYHTDVDRMGERGSMGAIGTEWASAAAAPGSLFKMYASEGGTRVPLIISGPGIGPQGFQDARSFVTDIAPTIVVMAGLPASEQIDGRSLATILATSEGEVYGNDDAIGLEVAGNAALFKGEYKLTRNTRPHGDAKWRLHNIVNDPGETLDLSNEESALLQEMLADYDRYATDLEVVALPADFDVQAQIGHNARAKMLRRHMFSLIIFSFVFCGLVFAFFRSVWKFWRS